MGGGGARLEVHPSHPRRSDAGEGFEWPNLVDVMHLFCSF
jgi:hypothetical protein